MVGGTKGHTDTEGKDWQQEWQSTRLSGSI